MNKLFMDFTLIYFSPSQYMRFYIDTLYRQELEYSWPDKLYPYVAGAVLYRRPLLLPIYVSIEIKDSV